MRFSRPFRRCCLKAGLWATDRLPLSVSLQGHRPSSKLAFLNKRGGGKYTQAHINIRLSQHAPSYRAHPCYSPRLTMDFLGSVRVSPAEIARIKSNPAAQALLTSLVKPYKVELYAPFLIGSWVDWVFLGYVLVLWVRWFIEVRPTDNKWTRILVYYLMIPSLFLSMVILMHNMRIFGYSFGDYTALLDITRAFSLSGKFRVTWDRGLIMQYLGFCQLPLSCPAYLQPPVSLSAPGVSISVHCGWSL